jgi:hypothetical protein
MKPSAEGPPPRPASTPRICCGWSAVPFRRGVYAAGQTGVTVAAVLAIATILGVGCAFGQRASAQESSHVKKECGRPFLRASRRSGGHRSHRQRKQRAMAAVEAERGRSWPIADLRARSLDCGLVIHGRV